MCGDLDSAGGVFDNPCRAGANGVDIPKARRRPRTINSLRSLLFLAGAAVAAAVTYAVIFGDPPSGDDGAPDGAGTRQVVRGDSSEFSLRTDGALIKARWDGRFKLDDTGDRITWVEDALTIFFEDDGQVEELELEKDGRDLAVRYEIDGDEQPAGPARDAAVDALALRFLRASAALAPERIDILMKKGGADAVIDEIERLTSGYAVKEYVVAFSESGALDDGALARLVPLIAGIDGDADRARALQALFSTQAPGPRARAALIDAATGIESDYDKRRLVAALAEHADQQGSVEAGLDILASIGSDYDARVAAVALLEARALPDAAAARVLTVAAETIDGGHDLRRVLEDAAPRLHDPAMVEAWFAAFDAMDSDYEKANAVEAAAAEAIGDASLAARLRAASETIASDYDRAKALSALD